MDLGLRRPLDGQNGDGDAITWVYTQWLAGGLLKHGYTHGQTDEIGLKTVENPVDTYDLHATVLQLLGLDHLKTIYLRAGRAERPTVVYGKWSRTFSPDPTMAICTSAWLLRRCWR